MALMSNVDNFGQIKRHLVINRELKYDVKTAIPMSSWSIIPEVMVFLKFLGFEKYQ